MNLNINNFKYDKSTPQILCHIFKTIVKHVLKASRCVLPLINTKDPDRTALSDANCLFSVIVYLGTQVAGFDAETDCITNMI